MNTKPLLVVSVVLMACGLIFAVDSGTQLAARTTLLDNSSIQIDSHSYVVYTLAVNLAGVSRPSIEGGVGSVGCCVDFYLVSDANWNSWSTNLSMRDALSAEHLNSTAVSSQSLQGQFALTPSDSGYSAVFVNDQYPNASGVQNVHVTITLQYTRQQALYAMLAGLAVMAVGVSVFTVTQPDK